jgi:RNA polymerase sigma factor (sigma-70 family)
MTTLKNMITFVKVISNYQYVKCNMTKDTMVPNNEPLLKVLGTKELNDILYSYACKLTGCKEKAKDLLQDTYVNIYSKLDRFDKNKMSDSATKWCTVVMHNKFIDNALKASNRVKYYNIDDESAKKSSDNFTNYDNIIEKTYHHNVKTPVDLITKKERIDDLKRFFNIIAKERKFAPSTIDIIKLRMFGLKLKEISKTLDIPINTIKGRMRRYRFAVEEYKKQYYSIHRTY